MSLRSRLHLVVGALVLVPLLVGALLTGIVLPREAREQRLDTLAADGAALAAELAEECRRAGATARSVALEATAADPAQAVRSAVESGASYAAVLDADGLPLAEAGTAPEQPPARLGSCSLGTAARGTLPEQVEVRDGEDPRLRVAVVADVLDAAALRALADRLDAGLDVVLADAQGPVASTLAPDRARTLATAVGDGDRAEAGGLLAVAAATDTADGLPWRVLAATPAPDPRPARLAAVLALLAATGLVSLVAGRLASGLTRPLSELGVAAERVAAGDPDAALPAQESEEGVRLAGSFSRMSSALQRSREEQRESLERLGEALAHTHDLEGLLTLVLQTGMDQTRACAGVAYALESAGTLCRAAALGLASRGLAAADRLPVGPGVLGAVAAGARPVRGRLGSGPEDLSPAEGEPAAGEMLAVPLLGGGRVVAVLALYDREGGGAYGPEEEAAVAPLTRQAGIAVENVLLHREAERLSITDAMTGLRNFRFLAMTLGKEIERAARYGREVSVLLLDIDHFKAVNDTYGHARGDAVLRELANRVGEGIRDIDLLARYGGEEFVLVLPETPTAGAASAAERVRGAVRREPFRGEGGEPDLHVTVSIGVATFPRDGETPATLMRAADTALYAAKAAGRDCVRSAVVSVP